MTEEGFRFSDPLGPVKILHIHESAMALKAIVVVDNVAAGPAIGGVRMAPDVSLEECFRLARAMTLKNAAAGLAHGGGKAVIFADPNMPGSDKEQLVRAFAGAIRDVSDYIPGPDMGTDERCMAWVHDETARAVGLPAVLGGIPLDELGATGFGLCAAARATMEYCRLQLRGARVAIQGFGSVGRHAARYLVAEGAVLVAAADSAGTLYHPGGLDLTELNALKATGASVVEAQRGERLERDAIIGIDCDLWIPAARPDVIREENVGQLNTRLVLEGANIPITEGAEQQLHERGVLVVPDIIANAGGVICAAMEYRGSTQVLAFQAIEEKIRVNTRSVLDEAGRRQVSPRNAALTLARERIRAAMELRRWSAPGTTLSMPRANDLTGKASAQP